MEEVRGGGGGGGREDLKDGIKKEGNRKREVEGNKRVGGKEGWLVCYSIQGPGEKAEWWNSGMAE